MVSEIIEQDEKQGSELLKSAEIACEVFDSYFHNTHIHTLQKFLIDYNF